MGPQQVGLLEEYANRAPNSFTRARQQVYLPLLIRVSSAAQPMAPTVAWWWIQLVLQPN